MPANLPPSLSSALSSDFYLLLHPHHPALCPAEHRRCSVLAGLCVGTHQLPHRHVDLPCPRTPDDPSSSHRHPTHAHPHLPGHQTQLGPPQVPPPALPKAFTNCFLEISRRLWCSFSLAQETAQQFCFSKSGTHKPGSFVFSTRIFLGLVPFPRGLGLEVVLRAPSAGHHLLDLVDRCRGWGKEDGTCLRLNSFRDGEIESDGGHGQRLGRRSSCQVYARFCGFFFSLLKIVKE